VREKKLDRTLLIRDKGRLEFVGYFFVNFDAAFLINKNSMNLG